MPTRRLKSASHHRGRRARREGGGGGEERDKFFEVVRPVNRITSGALSRVLAQDIFWIPTAFSAAMKPTLMLNVIEYRCSMDVLSCYFFYPAHILCGLTIRFHQNKNTPVMLFVVVLTLSHRYTHPSDQVLPVPGAKTHTTDSILLPTTRYMPWNPSHARGGEVGITVVLYFQSCVPVDITFSVNHPLKLWQRSASYFRFFRQKKVILMSRVLYALYKGGEYQ